MPEDGEITVIVHQVFNKITQLSKKIGMTPMGYLQVFSRCFTLGTPTKPYSSITVNNSRYTAALEPTDPSFIPNESDLMRASKKPWAYLVNKRLLSGHIYIARRGKCLAIAAGYHLTTFHLGLEAKVTLMSREDYDRLIMNDCPGSNQNKSKAAKMRSFRMHPDFIEPGSSSKANRTINIFAAIVSESFAVVFSDFARLMRMHVTSLDRHWTQADLEVGSPEWPLIWDAFPDGPDWVLERDSALASLERWRSDMLMGETGHSKAIVDVIAENGNRTFAGFGRHLANDFLHYAAFFPGAPCSWICSNDERFNRFRSSILNYTQIWRSPDFLRRCGMLTNSINPFAFNTSSDRNYTTGFIWVFRKSIVEMPQDLYNLYLQEGLFDPLHTIGQPYQYSGPICKQQFKRIDVNYHSHLDAFTVITAKVPEGWKDGPIQPFTDLREAGYSTTIGPAQFYEAKQNMIDPDHAMKVCIRPGRPRKLPSDGPGKKRKTPTIHSLSSSKPPVPKKRKVTIEDKGKENIISVPMSDHTPPLSPPQRLTRSQKHRTQMI
ncbi:hypothetical protein GALMADRAFT_91738 [Galerina marginata CBS 339.88]|uniref:Uncharacterized protein n=1 Tax=Galerina marginata (strain CBS 339.88) TaxID=685588 RepID=A0A067TM92_GALM3|nr:hypothetical protein GALMADRAFT_91738 [Galerina marginata CBS 339.88]